MEQKKYGTIKSLLTYALLAQLLSGALLTAIFIFGADMLALHYFKSEYAASVIQTFALFFIGINIFQIISQFFLAIQNTLYYKLCDFIRNGALLFSTIAMITLGIPTLEYFAYGWIIGLYI